MTKGRRDVGGAHTRAGSNARQRAARCSQVENLMCQREEQCRCARSGVARILDLRAENAYLYLRMRHMSYVSSKMRGRREREEKEEEDAKSETIDWISYDNAT